MREATPLGDGKFSFTILDPRVKEFVIEYTLPTVVDYVNKAGEPIIKKGWNLLSMPVRPVNPYYSNFYKNAINIPILFTQNQYQTPPDGILQPGIGYFVNTIQSLILNSLAHSSTTLIRMLLHSTVFVYTRRGTQLVQFLFHWVLTTLDLML
jgi:hypothetical protein